MSPNNGILFSSVFRSKLLNNPFASCFFINLDFLPIHTAHFDNNIVLPFLVFNTLHFTIYILSISFALRKMFNMFDNDLCLIYE